MHRLALVLVESSSPDVRARVEELMGPYQDPFNLRTCPDLFESGHDWQICFRCIEDSQHLDDLGWRDWRYDWWVVGGRFDGALRNEDPERFVRHWNALSRLGSVGVKPWIVDFDATFGARFDEMKQELFEANVVPVRDLPPDLRYSIVVTPDGDWHERMWEEDSEDDQQRWHELTDRLLKRHSDCLAVACDAHI